MAKSLPPLPWFRSFEAAARSLSFTAAAEEIGLTQSAVSQQVKALETRLGVPLFVRRPRGLSLTDEGRKLLPQVAQALAGLAAAADSYGAPQPGERLLTVAASVSIAQWVIAPALPRFTREHPGLRLRLQSAIWPDDFQASRADVQVRFGTRAQAGPGAVGLEPQGLVAVKAPSLAGRLDTLPRIEAVGTSSGWQAWSERFGGPARATLYADTYGMALNLAMHGGGVALVAQVIARHALVQNLVELAHPGTLPAAEAYYLSLAGGEAADPSPAKAFRDWLLTELSGAQYPADEDAK
ncbi:MAG: LysR family transcriptional regulator [Pseudomonadota bacterium]